MGLHSSPWSCHAKFKKINIEYKGLSKEDCNPAFTAIVVMLFGRKVCHGERMK